MKTYYPVTILLLMLAVGCSEPVKLKEDEAVHSGPVHVQVQPDIQVALGTFTVASSSLQLVPMPALIVTGILCQQFTDAEMHKLVSTLKTEVELTTSDLAVDGGWAPSTDN